MLIKHGLAKGTYAEHKDDGLELIDCRITNAVRCLPPQNKPTTEEMKNCRSFLAQEIEAMPNLGIILTLGRVAHEQVCRVFSAKPTQHPFAHGAKHTLAGKQMINSYHCSRYNTNTRRLTEKMFEDVVLQVKSG
jgi:uracil-DNA glycosylase family 4